MNRKVVKKGKRETKAIVPTYSKSKQTNLSMTWIDYILWPMVLNCQ